MFPIPSRMSNNRIRKNCSARLDHSDLAFDKSMPVAVTSPNDMSSSSIPSSKSNSVTSTCCNVAIKIPSPMGNKGKNILRQIHKTK